MLKYHLLALFIVDTVYFLLDGGAEIFKMMYLFNNRKVTLRVEYLIDCEDDLTLDLGLTLLWNLQILDFIKFEAILFFVHFNL